MRKVRTVWKAKAGVFLTTAAVILIPLRLCSVADSGSVRVPVPTGPYPVGTFTMRLVDLNRMDPYVQDGSKRELMVRFWYPAGNRQGCAPAEYTSPKVWGYMSLLLGMQAQPRTNSCWQALPLEGMHPLIVASHGYTGMFTDYTFLFEDLASRGYVVVSVAHTHETTAVEFPGGELRTSRVGSIFVDQTPLADDRSLHFAEAVRFEDLRFVAAEMARVNSGSGLLAEKLDLTRMGVLGHSMGADTALGVLARGGDFKVGVLLDAIEVSRDSQARSNKPVLLVSEGRVNWSESECAIWNHLSGPRSAIVFRGAEHLTPTDAIWLGDAVPDLRVKAGRMGVAKTISAIRDSVADFFDRYLASRSVPSLHDRFLTDSPDALVTLQEQSLCATSAERLGK